MMGIYIKVNDTEVELGGQVASEDMLNNGYFLYEGIVPNSTHLMWDVATKTLVVDQTNIDVSIQDARDRKFVEIKKDMSDELSLGFTTTSGITMDAELTSIMTLKAGYDLQLSFKAKTMTITDKNNIDHTGITMANVFKMIQELGVNYETLRIKKNTLRSDMLSLTDIQSIEQIVWSVNTNLAP